MVMRYSHPKSPAERSRMHVKRLCKSRMREVCHAGVQKLGSYLLLSSCVSDLLKQQIGVLEFFYNRSDQYHPKKTVYCDS